MLDEVMSDMMLRIHHQDPRTLFQALLEARALHGGGKPAVEDIERKPLTYDRLVTGALALVNLALATGKIGRPGGGCVRMGGHQEGYARPSDAHVGRPAPYIDQLIIATNSNDILHRCISGNDHSKKQLQHSMSPSMDIMVSSNFERMLFDLYERDGSQIRRLMEEFKSSGRLTLAAEPLGRAQNLFSSYRLSDEETVGVIREVFESTEYLLDPHTAIGVQAARKTRRDSATPMVCLATAHPAKFPDAVRQAGQVQDPALPHHMRDLFVREEQYQVLDDNLEQLKMFIGKNIRA